jgi:hypothetical protein
MANQKVKVDLQELPSKNAAAYLPFKTFLSAIEALEHGIPKKIDRTIWRTQAYVVQTQIIMALRFLGLLDNEDNPTPKLHQLVENKDDRKRVLHTILEDAYRRLVDLDLTKTTPKMLDDEMDKYSVSGDTKKKAVRFFLQAAKYVEMPMHPLLQSQVRNSNGPRKKRTTNKTGVSLAVSGIAGSVNGPGERPTSTQAAGMSNGGKIVLQVFGDPFALPSEERNLIFELVDKVREHAKAHPVEVESDEYEDEEEPE